MPTRAVTTSIHSAIPTDSPTRSSARSSRAPRQETTLLLAEARSLIKTLPPHQIEAFRLVALEGRSYEEASQSLGLALNTVKSRVARARARLSRMLDGEVERSRAQIPIETKPDDTYAEWKRSGLRLIG